MVDDEESSENLKFIAFVMCFMFPQHNSLNYCLKDSIQKILLDLRLVNAQSSLLTTKKIYKEF